jgi:AraC family transcriptional regulator
MTNANGQPLCRPYTVSHFEVEREIEANGIHVDIRRFGWDRYCEGHFAAESYYIDYSLIPRSGRSRLIRADRRHTPPPGEVVFLPRGAEFEARNEPCEQRLLCLTFEHERARQLFESGELAGDLAPCFDVRSPRVRQTLARLAEEVRVPGFGHDVLVEALALALVVELCRDLGSSDDRGEPPRGRIADWRLRRLRERIEAGLAEPLSIAGLAADCGISPRHLIRTFKNTVGVTLSDYIADARIGRAKQQLGRANALIKTVAYNCGFQSPAAFSAAFRKATGMTPRQFRQERFRFDA